MYHIWLGNKPLLNKCGLPAKFKYALALHMKTKYKWSKMRPCATKGKWKTRLDNYHA